MAVNFAHKIGSAHFAPVKGLNGMKYKKLLLVIKESKLTRFQAKGIAMSPYV